MEMRGEVELTPRQHNAAKRLNIKSHVFQRSRLVTSTALASHRLSNEPLHVVRAHHHRQRFRLHSILPAN
jgi:hypothetical protein